MEQYRLPWTGEEIDRAAGARAADEVRDVISDAERAESAVDIQQRDVVDLLGNLTILHDNINELISISDNSKGDALCEDIRGIKEIIRDNNILDSGSVFDTVNYLDLKYILAATTQTIHCTSFASRLVKPLALAFISNPSEESAVRFEELCDAYPEISDAINLGDCDNTVELHRALLCIGEKESENGSLSSVECYNKFIKDASGAWRVNVAENKCYYYKDYDDEHVRLICLDTEHWSAEQDEWFRNILSESYGYSVLTVTHRMAGILKVTKEDNRFGDLDAPNEFGRRSDVIFYITQEFIDNGGNFVAHVCGHFEKDSMYRPEEYPEQLVMSFEIPGPKDSFTIMVIDTDEDEFNLIRVGNNRDRLLRSKKILRYNYKTKQTIYIE